MSARWVSPDPLSHSITIGPWPLTVFKDVGRPDSWCAILTDGYGHHEDTIGTAPTLHRAKKLALEWVLQQISAASLEVATAAVEWKKEEVLEAGK